MEVLQKNTKIGALTQFQNIRNNRVPYGSVITQCREQIDQILNLWISFPFLFFFSSLVWVLFAQHWLGWKWKRTPQVHFLPWCFCPIHFPKSLTGLKNVGSIKGYILWGTQAVNNLSRKGWWIDPASYLTKPFNNSTESGWNILNILWWNPRHDSTHKNVWKKTFLWLLASSSFMFS